MKQMNIFTKQRLAGLENERTVASGGQGVDRGKGVWDGQVHTAMFKTDS